jgi:hypothetical protein
MAISAEMELKTSVRKIGNLGRSESIKNKSSVEWGK